jgi:hypothetical protein
MAALFSFIPCKVLLNTVSADISNQLLTIIDTYVLLTGYI